MTKRAYRMPVELAASTKIGPRLFRKTVLRSGRIEKGVHKIDVTPDFLTELANNFAAGVMDTVPLVIGHPRGDDVEKTRGRLAGLEVTGDGLVGTFEVGDDGATLLSKYPKIGCSVSIDPEFSRADGRKAGPTLVHVGLHNDPEVAGLGDWEPVALGADYEVIDLAQTPAKTSTGTGGGTEEKEAPVAISEEQIKAALLKIMKGDGGASTGAEDEKNDKPEVKKDAPKGKAKDDTKVELTEDQVTAALAKLLNFTDAELDDVSKPAEELVNAGHDEDGEDETAKALRLANDERQKLELRLAKVERERNDERFAKLRLDLAREHGIPTEVTDKLKPVLWAGGHTIELGNGKNANAGDLVLGALKELGTRYKAGLQLGVELGSAEAEDDQDKRLKDLNDFAARAHAEFGTGHFTADNK